MRLVGELKACRSLANDLYGLIFATHKAEGKNGIATTVKIQSEKIYMLQ